MKRSRESEDWRDKLRLNGVAHFMRKDWPNLVEMFEGNDRNVKALEYLSGKSLGSAKNVDVKATLKGLIPRQTSSKINNVNDLFDFMKKAKKILVLSGAGISTNVGIPDFRSQGSGLYSKIEEDLARSESKSKYVTEAAISDPQEIFDLDLFRENPEIFYRFAKYLYPDELPTKPSNTHLLLAKAPIPCQSIKIYTQNIDSLHQIAGSKDVVECHGSLRDLQCDDCKLRVAADDYLKNVRQGKVIKCPTCKSPLRPCITFFNEKLSSDVLTNFLEIDRFEADILLVIGSSLAAKPMSKMPLLMPDETPRIWINRDSTTNATKDAVMDVGWDCSLEGDADVVMEWLWNNLQGKSSNFQATLLPVVNPKDGPRYSIS